MGERFAGKVGFVTGGASGLGEALVRLMVAEGGSVGIADLHGDRAAALVAELGPAALAITCDVTIEADVANAIDATVAKFGHLDGVFANAGIVGVVGPIADTNMDDFDKTIAVLVRGVFVTVKHAARVMIAQGTGGAIVCTSSVAGIQGGLGPHAYTVAKTGVIGLARAASSELVAHKIRVNAIAPGSIPTAMTAHVMGGDPDDVDKATAIMAKQSPLGRSGLPIDIAEMALFFMTDAGSYISGQVIAVDAGLTTGASMSPRWESSAMVVARP